jgi:hypothetical protein
MRSLLWGIGLLLALSSPVMAQSVPCNLKAIYDASTSGSTKLIDGASGSNVYVCGFTFFSGGTVNVKLVYGTGATCGTGSVDLTPAFQFTAQTGIVEPSPVFRGLLVPAVQNLCINASSGVAVQAIVYYAKR